MLIPNSFRAAFVLAIVQPADPWSGWLTAGANLQFSSTRAGRLCEYAVVAAAGEQGISDGDVVNARRSYAGHLRINLQGPTQDADHPCHIDWACRADHSVNLGIAQARHENGRYYLIW